MFENFEDEMVNVGEVSLRVRHAGRGPAVLLIHGHPRTGSTWYKVAPALVERGFSVVCPDMRGYGQSEAAEVRDDHSQQSKRQVASDLSLVMHQLGHERYLVVGHDRGCYVGMRLCLDYPDDVAGYMPLDGIPISDALNTCNFVFAKQWFHWFFFAQPEKPEFAINADPMRWYGESPEEMGSENYQELADAVSDPETVRAMLEDYRAGLGVDFDQERLDRSNEASIDCPILFVWAARDDLTHLYGDPANVWKQWGRNVTAKPIDSTHHMSECAPEALTELIAEFGDSVFKHGPAGS